MSDSIRLVELAKSLIKETFIYAQDAHEFLFKDYRNEKNEFISGILLNRAISSYTCLKSFYYSNLNELEDSRVEDILHTGLMSIFWTQKVKLFYAALLANNSH